MIGWSAASESFVPYARRCMKWKCSAMVTFMFSYPSAGSFVGRLVLFSSSSRLFVRRVFFFFLLSAWFHVHLSLVRNQSSTKNPNAKSTRYSRWLLPPRS